MSNVVIGLSFLGWLIDFMCRDMKPLPPGGSGGCKARVTVRACSDFRGTAQGACAGFRSRKLVGESLPSRSHGTILHSIGEVARAYRWRREIQEFGVRAFAGSGQRRTDESRVIEPERKGGRQSLEERWVIADLLGKAAHIRNGPHPGMGRTAVEKWMKASGIRGAL